MRDNFHGIPNLYPQSHKRRLTVLLVLALVFCAGTIILLTGQATNPMAWISFAIPVAIGSWAISFMLEMRYMYLNSQFRNKVIARPCYWLNPERIHAIIRKGPTPEVAAMMVDIALAELEEQFARTMQRSNDAPVGVAVNMIEAAEALQEKVSS